MFTNKNSKVGNLVLGRRQNQSIFIGEGADAVKITVLDSSKMSLAYQASLNVEIKPLDEQKTEITLADGKIVEVVAVSTNNHVVKLAILADRSVKVDREEVRYNRNK